MTESSAPPPVIPPAPLEVRLLDREGVEHRFILNDAGAWRSEGGTGIWVDESVPGRFSASCRWARGGSVLALTETSSDAWKALGKLTRTLTGSGITADDLLGVSR